MVVKDRKLACPRLLHYLEDHPEIESPQSITLGQLLRVIQDDVSKWHGGKVSALECDLTATQRKILEAVDTHEAANEPNIDHQEIADLANMTPDAARHHLATLKTLGWLKHIGIGKGYRLTRPISF